MAICQKLKYKVGQMVYYVDCSEDNEGYEPDSDYYESLVGQWGRVVSLETDLSPKPYYVVKFEDGEHRGIFEEGLRAEGANCDLLSEETARKGAEEELVTSINEYHRQFLARLSGRWLVEPSSGLPTNTNNKGGIMAYLRNVPSKLKRMLNANYRAFYQLGWVCEEDLSLTNDGSYHLEEFLLDKYESEMGSLAKKKVKEIEAEKKG